MEFVADVGGRTGIDCGGFCRFCFYRNLDFDDLLRARLGCVHCPPDQFGCSECWKPVDRIKSKFKTLPTIFNEVEKNLAIYYNLKGDLKDAKISISGGADVFNYPHLIELISILNQSEYPIYLGYTSGKTIKDRSLAARIISLGLDQLNFSIFSTDPELRSKWVRDRNSEEAIASLKMFCESIDVNVSVVVIPGVNDEEQIFKTASDLEEWGVNSLVLRRFANFKHQGLILNDNKPVLEGVSTHSYDEFNELVKKVDEEFSLEVLSFPFYSPHTDFPFAIAKKENREFLEYLPTVESEATVVTGGIAGPFLEEIFSRVDESGLVNVVTLEKEIADLITHEDLDPISLEGIKRRVILPYGALVKDNQAEEILSRDGISRKIIRGPKVLTHPYYEGVSFNRDELIRYELKSFSSLIDKINHG